MHVARDEHGIPYVSSYEEEARGKTPSAFDLRDKIERIEEFLFRSVSLQCKQLHPDAILPAKAGPEEAGWDICCVADQLFSRLGDLVQITGEVRTEWGMESLSDDELVYPMFPGEAHKFHTGFSCAIERGYCMLLWDRSGLGGSKKIHRLAGVIDCTYRGEWLVSLINLSNETYAFKPGDKIVQGILEKVIPGKSYWVDELPNSVRGEAGFGSTGR